MADRITPQERAMIDAALARGEVTQCPPRTFALDPGQAVPLRAQINTLMAAQKRGQNTKAVNDARGRRLSLTELADGTRTKAEVADLIGISLKTLYLYRLRLKGKGVPMEFADGRKRRLEAAE